MDIKNNTGHLNTGHRNTGHRNTGDLNTGHYNTGNRNTGDLNTGHWNTGHRNTGFFCTETPNATFFDLPTNLSFEEAVALIPSVELSIGAEWVASSQMTTEEQLANPNHSTIGGFLREHNLPLQTAFPLAWTKMSDAEKLKWTSLPNFAAEKLV